MFYMFIKYYWKYDGKLRGMNRVIGLNMAYNYLSTMGLLKSKLFILIPYPRDVNVLIVENRMLIKSNWVY
jgi:hypothetical protein